MALNKTAELGIPTDSKAISLNPLTGDGSGENPLTLRGLGGQSNLYVSAGSAAQYQASATVVPNMSTGSAASYLMHVSGFVTAKNTNQGELCRWAGPWIASRPILNALVLDGNGGVSYAKVRAETRTIYTYAGSSAAPAGVYLLDLMFPVSPQTFSFTDWNPVTSGTVGTNATFQFTIDGADATTSMGYFNVVSSDKSVASTFLAGEGDWSSGTTRTLSLTISPLKPGTTKITVLATNFYSKTFTFTVTE